MKKKYIYISIEIFNREIYGVLELLQAAILENYNVVLGDRQSLLKNIDNLPRGVLFYKSASIIDEIFYNAFYRHGHKLVCLDAEGLIFHNLNYFFKHRLTLTNLKKLDYYFLWGSKQYEAAIKKFPQFKNKFKITGGLNAVNWFIDEKLFKKNKKKEKALIFFTSFGSYNHFSNDQMKDNLEIKIYKLNKTDKKFIYDYSKYIKKLFFDYQIIIEKIANLITPMKIFIKIHPSENPEPWKKLAEKHENIKISERSVENLISLDGIIIQSESTTGVQSYINKKKTFSYIPKEYKDSQLPIKLIKNCSNVIYEIEQFTNKINNILKFSNLNNINKYNLNCLSEYFNNINQKNISKLILSNLKNLDLSDNNDINIDKKISYFKLVFFFILCILKTRFIIILNFFPTRIKDLAEEKYLAYGSPKKQFTYFLKFLFEQIPFKILFSDKFKKKFLKKIELFESYGDRKRKQLSLEYLVKNFEILKSYKLKELEKKLILIKG